MSTTRMRRGARVPAALALVVGLGLTGLSGSAGAAAVEAAGWWWRPNSAVLPIPVPPRADVGTDQVLVEGEPEGATAVAGVRFLLAEGESSPVLAVTPSGDSVLPDDAVVLACRVTSNWVSAQGGKWESRPGADCLTSVQGIRSEDGKLVFALAPLQSGSTLDVVFTPGAGSVFSLKFLTPTPADLKTSTDAGGASTGGDFAAPDPSSFGADTETGGDSGSFDPGPTTSFDTGAGAGTTGSDFGSAAFTQPSTFTPPPTVPVAVAAPSGAAPVAAAPSGSEGTPVAAVPASNTNDTKKGRTLGILVLLAGGALGFWAYSGGPSGGGLLGGAGATGAPGSATGAGPEPVVGGLGRFARPRTGPPPTLG